MATIFTFVNKCQSIIWPEILTNSGSPNLDSTVFELPTDTSRSFGAPTGWSGRFQAQTDCNFDGSGLGYCATGDCGSDNEECNGSRANPIATLAKFTLGTGGQDFYDISLVDGYNLPMLVEVNGGSGLCALTGCVVDLNWVCPSELKVGLERIPSWRERVLQRRGRKAHVMMGVFGVFLLDQVIKGVERGFIKLERVVWGGRGIESFKSHYNIFALLCQALLKLLGSRD